MEAVATSESGLGQQRIQFGRHAGKSFEELAQADPGYCRWALVQPNPSGQLAQFTEYLHQLPKRQSHAQVAGLKRVLPAGAETGGTEAKQPRLEALTRPPARPLAVSSRTFKLQWRYFDLIRSGQKRWEGRLKVGAAVGLSVGCKVTFSCGSSDLEMTVRSVREFRTFEDMLRELGVETLLPGVGSVSQGVAVYHGFPGYAEKERRFGVVAMELMPPGASFTLGM